MVILANTNAMLKSIFLCATPKEFFFKSTWDIDIAMIALLLHKHTHLFTDALTGIILRVYQVGWSVPVKKRWPALAQSGLLRWGTDWLRDLRMFVRFVSVYFLWFYLLRVRVIPLARSPNSVISSRYTANTRSKLVYTRPCGRDA